MSTFGLRRSIADGGYSEDDRPRRRGPVTLEDRIAAANAASFDEFDAVLGEYIGPFARWAEIRDMYGRDVVRAQCTHPEVVTYLCGDKAA